MIEVIVGVAADVVIVITGVYIYDMVREHFL